MNSQLPLGMQNIAYGENLPMVEHIRAARINELFQRFIERHMEYRASQLGFIRTLRSWAINREKASINAFERNEPYSIRSWGHWRLLFTPEQIAELLWLCNLVALPIQKAVVGPLPDSTYVVVRNSDGELQEVYPIGYHPNGKYTMRKVKLKTEAP